MMRDCYIVVGKNKKRNVSWLYKAYFCLNKANRAKDTMTEKIQQLDSKAQNVIDDYNFKLNYQTLKILDPQLEYDYDSVIYYFLSTKIDTSLKP